MRNETLAIHGGYSSDSATRAVAAPIYQNVAYEFESADQAAANVGQGHQGCGVVGFHGAAVEDFGGLPWQAEVQRALSIRAN